MFLRITLLAANIVFPSVLMCWGEVNDIAKGVL